MPRPAATASHPLAGQSALVTGASSGIGAAIAQAMAAAGAAVAVNYHGDQDGAERVVAAIEAAGGRAFACRADVSDEDAVAAMMTVAVARFGTVHIMVANAGIQRDAPLLDMSLRQWRAVIDTNLTGAFLCARAAVAEFLRRGPRPGVSRSLGNILFMSSVHQVIPWAGRANYAASKGGVAMLMRSVAREVAGRRIRVNAIAPGAIRTGINRQSWGTPEAERELMKLIPYGRVGEPEDIAAPAVWLASDAADYVTGATLFVDGGMTLYPGFGE